MINHNQEPLRIPPLLMRRSHIEHHWCNNGVANLLHIYSYPRRVPASSASNDANRLSRDPTNTNIKNGTIQSVRCNASDDKWVEKYGSHFSLWYMSWRPLSPSPLSLFEICEHAHFKVCEYFSRRFSYFEGECIDGKYMNRCCCCSINKNNVISTTRERWDSVL